MNDLHQPMTPPFDVVVVSDFIGPTSRRFEILTLFFLASWLEFGGRSRELPLHIVAIGRAPESVRTLANRCGAEITEHAPLLFGGFANKLRGFEVRGRTDHVLLLDSDVLALSDIRELSAVLGDRTISAAATNGPCPLRGKRWHEIHQALELPYPDQQVTPLNVELDTFQRANFRRGKDFPPYYNGGIVYSPWAAGLGHLWRDHLQRFQKLAPYRTGRDKMISNQPSLATAIHALQLEGCEFQLLPAPYNTRWQHISPEPLPHNRLSCSTRSGLVKTTQAPTKTKRSVMWRNIWSRLSS